MGALSAVQRLIVKYDLLGGPKAMAQNTGIASSFNKVNASVRAVGAASLTTAKSMKIMTASSLQSNAVGGRLRKTWGTVGSGWQALTKAANRSSGATNRMSAAGLAYNQVLFTLRRATFYGTLAIVGMTAAVLKLGYQYDESMASARAALEKVIKPTQQLDAELRKLFLLAAVTPFTFEDTTKAFRRMYFALHPVGVSIKTINGLLTSTTDILSAAGAVTPASLNRVSVAFQKLGTQGYLTGRVVNSLISDGIPITNALRKELHLTSDQLGNIAALRLPANTVMAAIIAYGKTAQFRGQALAQANKTLFGAFSSFKDLLSMSVGAKEAGPLEGLRKVLFGVNQQLFPMLAANKSVSITRIAEAFDKSLTPKTHTVIEMFTLLEYTLKSLTKIFEGFFWVIFGGLRIFNKLTDHFHSHLVVTKLLGWALGGLIAAFILLKLTLFGVNTANEILMLKNSRLGVRIWYVSKIITGTWIPALMKSTAAQAIFNAVAGMNPYVRIILAVIILIGLFVLMYKKWKFFHDIVQSTWKWIIRHKHEVELALVVSLGPIGVALSAMIELIARWKQFQHLAGKVASPLGSPTKKPSWSARNIFSLHGNTPFDAFLKRQKAPKFLKHFSASSFLFGPDLIRKILGFASGGAVASSGLAMVGESGPEVVHLPAGSNVIPMAKQGINPIGSAVSTTLSGRPPEIIQLVVDRKVLAQVVAHARQDQLARK